ncbi:MAG: DUF1820 family protein [Proteobacteria bacterium]|nr:DUF1820 family protein [Pseudomonadota bacterium]
MSKTDRPIIYRIVFTQEDQIQEIYAQYISEETLVGFIEADTLLEFETSKSVVDTKEVRRCYIPLHNIIRIDEVSWHNDEKIKNNISHLPHAFKKAKEKK